MGSPRVEDEEDLDRDAAAAPSGAAGTAVPYLDQQVAAGLASEGAPVWVETRGRETEAELYAAMCTGFMAGEEDFTAEARTTREQDGVEWPEGGVDHIRARLLNAEGQEVAVSNAMGLAPTRDTSGRDRESGVGLVNAGGPQRACGRVPHGPRPAHEWETSSDVAGRGPTLWTKETDARRGRTVAWTQAC